MPSGGRREKKAPAELESAQANNAQAFKERFTPDKIERTFEVVEKLALEDSDEVSPTVRVRALELWLAYGMGKPGVTSQNVTAEQVTAEQLAALAAELESIEA